MRSTPRRYRGWLAILVLAAQALAVDAAPQDASADPQAPGIAAVLLLDSSGSMKRTDPQRLRVPAAQLFVSLLQPEDRAAVVSFSDAGYPVVRLSQASAAGRERLSAGVDKVSSKGAHTNLHAALSQGLELLQPAVAETQRRYLILLSDGHMDTGDEARDRDLIQRIEQQLVPALRQQNIKVYSIAFTRASDVDLLRSVAVETGGVFQLVENQDDLHTAFAEIFESAKSPNMLPMDQGRFEVDSAVRELTVVAAHDQGAAAVQLRPPDGNVMTYRAHPEPVRWMHSPRFDLITVPNPAPGAWSLSTGDQGNRAYVVTDLELRTELHATQLPKGEDLRLRAWLADDGEPLLRPEVLSTTQFMIDMQLPDGSQRSIALRPPGADGAVAAKLPMDQAGDVRLTLIARSATFERQTRHLVQVLPRTSGPAPSPSPSTTPTFIVPPIELPIPTAPEPPGGEPQTPTQVAPEPVEADVPAAESEPQQPFRFGTVLWIFLAVNMVLVALIAAVVFWRKRRAARSPTAPSDEE